MAAANSVVPSFIPPNTTQNTLLKLNSGNYTSWSTQINPILHTHDLMGFVNGSEPYPSKTTTDEEGKVILNPEYLTWNKKDHYLLSVITGSLSKKVLANCLWVEHFTTSLDGIGNQICLQVKVSYP